MEAYGFNPEKSPEPFLAGATPETTRNMQCIKPIWLARESLRVPCGKCIACRKAKAREWATRLFHEQEYYSESAFVTLTYNDSNLPTGGTLKSTHLRDWMKRLRKRIASQDPNRRIKYFACGEYGDQTNRPHYHAIIFGLKKCNTCYACNKPLRNRGADEPKFDCRLCRESWNFGDIDIGSVEYASIRYVSKYVQKKTYGDHAKTLYKDREAPFQRQSQGLGLRYAEDNQEYFRSKLGCTVFGTEVGIPKYYSLKLEIPAEDRRQKAIEREREIDRLIREHNPDHENPSYEVIMREIADREAREHLLKKREQLFVEAKNAKFSLLDI